MCRKAPSPYAGGARGVNFNLSPSLGKILSCQLGTKGAKEGMTHPAITWISSLSGVRSCSQSINTLAVPRVAARCIEAY
jgi:hypothetical protein